MSAPQLPEDRALWTPADYLAAMRAGRKAGRRQRVIAGALVDEMHHRGIEPDARTLLHIQELDEQLEELDEQIRRLAEQVEGRGE